jgi:hypothetical protein
VADDVLKEVFVVHVITLLNRLIQMAPKL